MSSTRASTHLHPFHPTLSPKLSLPSAPTTYLQLCSSSSATTALLRRRVWHPTKRSSSTSSSSSFSDEPESYSTAIQRESSRPRLFSTFVDRQFSLSLPRLGFLASRGRNGKTNLFSSFLRTMVVLKTADRYRSLFKFGCFNAVQSQCFETAMKTDENLVVSGESTFRAMRTSRS